jgi:low affinity Fe/Cu permease
MKELFHRFAHRISNMAGHPAAFVLATATIVIWAVLGPTFHYSDTWQLIINTGTTIITFLMVFLIQNTQNRDGFAMQLKLDELIRANKHARNALIDVQELSDEELDKVHDELCQLHEHTLAKIEEVKSSRKKRKK